MHLKVIHGWRDVEPEHRGAAIALGEFDGVHRGHQRVIAAAATAAGRLRAPLGVISFEPHPRRWFHPEVEPFRLMSLDQQARALDDLGVDFFYVLPFDAEMAQMSDETFAIDVLANGLGARHIAAGFDITFGKGRSGDPDALKLYGEAHGFTVSIAERAGDTRAEKFSSSAVREALKAGHPQRATEILGKPFAIEGVVVEGQKLGRKLGFPTANVSGGDYVRPRLGSYATRTRLADGRDIPGVANFGVNPTTGLVEARLEVWLFDFDEDLYGQTIETDLVAFLRPELKFEGLEALIDQIGKDAAEAKAILTPPI
ncbi:MAG TPA: bifunctional riboflavin kinase/FAD synthetase [Caulobacteraceae bacterium]